ncbi:hypothetical protein N7474_005074 [Penicillium riverlandense]|uniref:uncharacterized protein n=1 Tax=Penicillium riverlandense TaxID=1903569 RepID=UPI002546A18D|nr:uncharacterized protein N7474_005074 [Penicillium riverlandense]KAJ5819483.1 hypothetical protein N7474_005074 [Penicillium riverlandense]
MAQNIERATDLDSDTKIMLRELGIESPLLKTTAGARSGQGIGHAQLRDRFPAGDTAQQTRQPRPNATQRSTLQQGLQAATQSRSPPQPLPDLGVSWPMNQPSYPSSGNPPSNHVEAPSHPAPGLPQGTVGTMQQQNGFTFDPAQFGASTANGNGLSMHSSQIPTTQQGVANWEFAGQNPVSAASTNARAQHPDIYDLDSFFEGLGGNI